MAPNRYGHHECKIGAMVGSRGGWSAKPGVDRGIPLVGQVLRGKAGSEGRITELSSGGRWMNGKATAVLAVRCHAMPAQ